MKGSSWRMRTDLLSPRKSRRKGSPGATRAAVGERACPRRVCLTEPVVIREGEPGFHCTAVMRVHLSKPLQFPQHAPSSVVGGAAAGRP